MLRFLTAGESHGPELVAVVEGFPAGFDIDLAKINHDLARRQKGYGRGGRMAIESDEVRVVSGIRFGRTMGSPITFIVENRDYKNWQKRMSADPRDRGEAEAGHPAAPRPCRSGRRAEIQPRGYPRRAGARLGARDHGARRGRRARQADSRALRNRRAGLRRQHRRRPRRETPADLSIEELKRITEDSQVRVADAEAERAIIAEIDACKKTGDTLGGVVEVIATGLPVGLGSHVQWDRKLDGRLAHALLSLQAVKGVEFGMGFRAAACAARDCMTKSATTRRARRFTRHSNNSGGTEGGMTTGEPLRVRVAFKPLSTLMRPLRSVDIKTKAEAVGTSSAPTYARFRPPR